MKRQIVKIDRELCNGCGECIPNCHEGALQMIDGKATLVSELMCDGLGACIGHCPSGAITIEEREAEAYHETETIKEIVKQGKNVVIAHLQHLKDHQQIEYLRQGVKYLLENERELPFSADEVIHLVHHHIAGHLDNKKEVQAQFVQIPAHQHVAGCPGSASRVFTKPETFAESQATENQSALSHWPVQMHLINPNASHFKGSDLVFAADCASFAAGNFHQKFLRGKTLTIACPKLDSDKDAYVEKLIRLVDDALINTITVVRMEVPCCGGLEQMVKIALSQSKRKVPVKVIMLSVQGTIISDEWI